MATTMTALYAFNMQGGTNTGYIDIREGAPRDVNALQEWALAYGVQKSDGFQFINQDSIIGLDVSIMTNQDVPVSTPVLYVPSQMILSSTMAKEEFGYQNLREAEKLLKGLNFVDSELPYFYLMLQILVEYEKGIESPYFPWLNSLPRYYANGASMTNLCFECLPPLARSLAMKERTKQQNLSNLNKIPFLSEQTKNNPNLIQWAFQIVYTRSHLDEATGDVRIIPMADYFNHASVDAEIQLVFDDQGNCYAQTTHDIPAGSPLRISYGDYGTNPSFLLARYGFLDETSPASFCKIMIPHIDSKLKDIGYDPTRMLFFKDSGEVSPEVFDVLLYQILSSTNARRRREFYDAHMNQDVQAKQSFHEVYWPETSQRLLQHIDQFLLELEQLTSKSYGKNVQEHPRLPLILAHNEFVKNTFLMVRQRYFS